MPSDPWTFGWDQIIAASNFGAIVVGIFVARDSLKKWQGERVAARQCEIAEEVISIVYEARGVFDDIRNPGYAGSVPKVIFERLHSYKLYWERIQKARIGAGVYFGGAGLAPLNEIIKLKNRVIVAAASIDSANRRLTGVSEEKREKLLLEMDSFEEFLFDASPTSSITKDIDLATEQVEKALLPILRKFKSGG